jgi:hypothetical protein
VKDRAKTLETRADETTRKAENGMMQKLTAEQQRDFWSLGQTQYAPSRQIEY